MNFRELSVPLIRQLYCFLAAVMFLTRVRIPARLQPSCYDRETLANSVIYFPIVGGMIGMATGVFYLITSCFWPPSVAILMALLFEAALTGAFHEDAVADCCDAFGGGWTREDILRIMKDSRVGSYGTLGLVLAVTVRYSCLASLPNEVVLAALCASAAIGRWATVLLSYWVPPAPSQDGLAKDINATISAKGLFISSIFASIPIALFVYIDPIRTFTGIGLVIIATGLWGQYVRERISYITGDCLGAGCYLAQIVFLLTSVMGHAG